MYLIFDYYSRKKKKQTLSVKCDSLYYRNYLDIKKFDIMSASTEASAIVEYFKRKTVFITGATGYYNISIACIVYFQRFV